MIPYGRHFIDENDIKAVNEVLKSDYITQGANIEKFEKKLSEYCNAEYAVVFNSGTSALHAAYFSVGLEENDEFITSPLTFVATSNAGLFLKARPIFVDVEHDTGNLNVSLIEEKITKKTKVIVPVHYAGHPCDLKKIRDIAYKNNLFIVEDACHAIGAEFGGVKIGSCKYSDATVFSFHPVKHITTGEGGAVLTNNKQIYEKLLMFRSHGITKDKNKFLNKEVGDWFYEMHFLGYNYRMTDIQAALGLSQIKKLDKFIKRRREIVEMYNIAFRDNPYFDIPVEKDYVFHAYHLYSIRLKNKFKKRKNEIFKKLKEKGIGVQVHYIPVYFQPYYQQLGYKKGICPISEEYYLKEISLPLFPKMDPNDVKFVIEKVFEVMELYD